MNIYDVIVRILLSVLIGGLIGYEREIRNRPAGFRTHILVCLGATIVTMVQVNLVKDSMEFLLANPKVADALKVDSGRIVAQVVSGIGFLGAGTIIVHKGTVKGLTTASTVWLVACIGIAIGYGYYWIALIAGVVTFLVNLLFKSVERRIAESRYNINIVVTYKIGKSNSNLEDIVGYIKGKNIRIGDMKFIECDEKGLEKVSFRLYSMKLRTWDFLLKDLNEKKAVISIDVI